MASEEVVFASKGTKQIILDTVATILDGMTCNPGKDIIGQSQGKADMRFVKNFTQPDFRARNFYREKCVNLEYLYSQ